MNARRRLAAIRFRHALIRVPTDIAFFIFFTLKGAIVGKPRLVLFRAP